jgi:hypothetical protein
MIDEQKIQRLADGLVDPRGDAGRVLELEPARLLPLWWVEREYGGNDLWCYVTPADRPEAVPWAVPPMRRCTRAKLVETLRELWLPDAVRWLAD